MILHYLKVAIRNLLKYRVQTVVSVVGLAVGVFCFSVCFYCSRFVEETDRCFRLYDRIAELHLHSEQGYFSGAPIPLYEELRGWGMSEVEAMSCITFPRDRSYYAEVSPDKELPYELTTLEVDSCYNRVFTPTLVTGTWAGVCRTPNAVVLCRSAAMRIFGGGIEAMGKHLTLMRRLKSSPESTPPSGGIVYTVAAVMEDLPLNNSFHFMHPIDMLTVNDSEGLIQSPLRHRDVTGSSVYALLAPHASLKSLRQQLEQRGCTWTLFGTTYRVEPLHIGALMKSQSTYLLAWTTGTVGTLILLVGLVNFFHFLIGSFLNRTREYSLLKMHGCQGRHLFCQLFVQTALIMLLVGLLVLCGLELAGGHIDFSLKYVSMHFDRALLMRHAVQYIGILLLLCAAVCLWMAVRIRHISIQGGLRGTGMRRGRQWGRSLMLGVQFFICWIFVSLSVALFLQARTTGQTLFHTLSRQEKQEILSIPLAYDFLKNEEKLALTERFRQHAGVKAMMLSDIAYTRGVSGNGLLAERGNDASWMTLNVMCVPRNFFSFMNLPMEQGRELRTEQDLVVDRTWQQRQAKEVMSTTFYNGDEGYTVVGICAPFQTDIHYRPQGYAFMLFDPSVYVGHCYLKCHAGQQQEVARWVAQVLRESLPENIAPRMQTLQDDIHDEQELEYNLRGIILFFALVSIVITLLGVYSSITLDTERRQKEVAIRKVNDARVADIIRLFARLYVVLLAVSALVAFPLVYAALTMWRQMYNVFFSHGPLYWLFVFLLVSLVTAITILFRILRTARMNPAEVVKRE